MKVNRCYPQFFCERQDDCSYFKKRETPSPYSRLALCEHCSMTGQCESEEAIRARIELFMRRWEK